MRSEFNSGQLSEGMRNRHVLYGSTFSTDRIGKDCIYTIDPENIHAITANPFGDFEKSKWAVEAVRHIGSGVLLNEGEAWSRSRTMLKPIFSRTVVDEPTLMEPKVRSLITQMKLMHEREGAFEFHSLVDMLMLDVVTEFLLGKSTGCLEIPRSPEGEDAIQFLKLVRGFDGPAAKFMALDAPARLELLKSKPQLEKMVAGMQAFFRRKLADIMASTESAPTRSPPWSVFRTMKAEGYAEEQIQGELQNIFFASWDTTSALLANTLYVLVRNQPVQHRLREEIRSLHGNAPTKPDLSKMKYLPLVIKEGSFRPPSQTIKARHIVQVHVWPIKHPPRINPTEIMTLGCTALRLYSPVASHSRTAKVDTTLPRGGGPDGQSPIVIRAGATVVWSTYSLNRDPRWYGPDWAEFRPERWASPTRLWATHPKPADSATGFGIGADNFFMPFGHGPRACLGQKMALDEVSYVIVRLLQEFPCLVTKAGVEHSPFKEAEAVSFYNADGVWVSLGAAASSLQAGRGS
ncbi:hypothetical protein diail_8250 [Diaporthe ilicicola]|nr:hypothetical protein diail_8250 [Diaporthe ilicicola]